MILSPVSPASSLSAVERPGAMLKIEPPPGGTTKPFASTFVSPMFGTIVTAFGSILNRSRQGRMQRIEEGGRLCLLTIMSVSAAPSPIYEALLNRKAATYLR